MPRQARSKATVDAVITATTQVLVEHGFEGATTARIAERAGVSIGSLYQYFPNKEALITVLVRRHVDEVSWLTQRTLEDGASATLEDGLRALIRAGTTVHRGDLALNRILHEQAPRIGSLKQAMGSNRRTTHAIERFLRAHADELRPGRDPAIAAIFIDTAIEAIEHKTVIERPDLLASGIVDQ